MVYDFSGKKITFEKTSKPLNNDLNNGPGIYGVSKASATQLQLKL